MPFVSSPQHITQTSLENIVEKVWKSSVGGVGKCQGSPVLVERYGAQT